MGASVQPTPPISTDDLLASGVHAAPGQAATPVNSDDLLAAPTRTGRQWDPAPGERNLLGQVTGDHPTAQAFFDHLANAASFGLGPKAVAAAEGAGDAVSGRGYDYGRRLGALQQTLGAERRESPVASTLGEGAGAVLSPIGLGVGKAAAGAVKGAGILAGIGSGAAAGGAVGAAYGAGTSSGSLADRAAQTGEGAVGGAVAGGALGAIGGVAGKLLEFFRPASASTQLARAAADAEPASSSASRMPADQAQDLTRFLRGQSPKARETIDAALAQRAQQQYPRLVGVLAESMGVDPQSAATEIPDQITAMKARATPFYQAAYDAPPITDPAFAKSFLSLANTAGGKAAYEAGARIADAEGEPLGALPKAGQLGKPPWVNGMREVLGRDPTPQEVQMAVANNPALANETPGGISVRQLDYMKRGLDAIIDSRQNATATLSRQEGRALRFRLNGLLQQADQLVPAYGAARQTAATGFALEDAASLGREHFASPGAATPEDVRATVADMSDPERRIYTQAAVGQALDKLRATAGSATGKADLVGKLWSSIGGREKLLALAPTRQQGDQMAQAMEDLASENETRAYVSRGSQTEPQRSLAGAFRSAMPSPWLALDAMRGDPAALGYVGVRTLGALGKQANPRVAEALAPMMVRPGASLQDILAEAAHTARPSAPTPVLPTLIRAAAVLPESRRLSAGAP